MIRNLIFIFKNCPMTLQLLEVFYAIQFELILVFKPFKFSIEKILYFLSHFLTYVYYSMKLIVEGRFGFNCYSLF